MKVEEKHFYRFVIIQLILSVNSLFAVGLYFNVVEKE